MGSIIAKWQKCGNQSCRCAEGTLHGPYFWLVEYISKKSIDKRSGKYSWLYLGRTPEKVWEKLNEVDKRITSKHNLSDLNDKIRKLQQSRKTDINQKTVQRILSVPDINTDR